jgi:trk system potassium uptake protein TrkA
MKVLVRGAGQVGSGIARHLAGEGNNVTIIDNRAEVARKVGDAIEVTTIIGNAAHPDVLNHAGARDADMLVAVTHFDEVNMVARQAAHTAIKRFEQMFAVRMEFF